MGDADAGTAPAVSARLPGVYDGNKSPSADVAGLQAKIKIYLANGTQLGFLLNAEVETAYVYCPDQPAETVQGYDQQLSGEPVLPGFRLDLRPLRRACTPLNNTCV